MYVWLAPIPNNSKNAIIFFLSLSAIDICIARSAKLQYNVRVGLIKMGKKLGGCSGKRGFIKIKINIKNRPCGFPQ